MLNLPFHPKCHTFTYFTDHLRSNVLPTIIIITPLLFTYTPHLTFSAKPTKIYQISIHISLKLVIYCHKFNFCSNFYIYCNIPLKLFLFSVIRLIKSLANVSIWPSMVKCAYYDQFNNMTKVIDLYCSSSLSNLSTLQFYCTKTKP